MSVLIRGAKAPSCCMFCSISNASGCGLTNPPVIMTTREMLAGRPDWCPMVDIPAHGRLIDADALNYTMLYKEDWIAGTGTEAPAVWKKDIDSAPTIIPAEDKP